MSRDLTGFAKRSVAVPAPPPPPAPASSPAAQPPPAQTSQENRPRQRSTPSKAGKSQVDKAPRRIKVGVSLPAKLHGQLRAATEERLCFKADVVLDAFDAFGGQLRQEHKESAQGRRARAGRRRRVVDGTACELYVTEDERLSLDQLAAEVGESRSALVTRLLELELGEGHGVGGS